MELEKDLEGHQQIRQGESIGARWFSYCLFFSIVGVLSKGKLWVLFADFHKKGLFEKSSSTTFISLLPKVAGANDINKFRPIRLVASVYKMMAKVLASRLRKVIGKVVGPYQHDVTAGHQILDATLIANECIESCLKTNLPSLSISPTSKEL